MTAVIVLGEQSVIEFAGRAAREIDEFGPPAEFRDDARDIGAAAAGEMLLVDGPRLQRRTHMFRVAADIDGGIEGNRKNAFHGLCRVGA